MIAYKVVEKKTRKGSNWVMFKRNHWKNYFNYDIKRIRRGGYMFLFPTYRRGSIIKADPRTVGILCFATKEDAVQFQINYKLELSTKIIKVKGYEDRAKWNPNLVGGAGEIWPLIRKVFEKDCYEKLHWTKEISIVAFPKIEVLD